MRQPTSLFQVRQLLFVTLVFVIFSSCNNSDEEKRQKEDVKIEIVHGDPGSEKVILVPGGDTAVTVYSGKKVTWSIATDSNVDSFFIEKKKSSKQIFYFFAHPPSKRTKKGEGRVDIFRNDAVYEYTIHWKEKGSTYWHKHDPKIAVRPTNFTFIELAFLSILGLLGLFICYKSFAVIYKFFAKK